MDEFIASIEDITKTYDFDAETLERLEFRRIKLLKRHFSGKDVDKSKKYFKQEIEYVKKHKDIGDINNIINHMQSHLSTKVLDEHEAIMKELCVIIDSKMSHLENKEDHIVYTKTDLLKLMLLLRGEK
jgi:hypothetical protein